MASSARLEIRLFERLALTFDGVALPFRVPARAASLLAYLLLDSKRAMPRDSVAFALWSDHPEDEARTKLRSALHALTAALPPAESSPWILADKRTLQWNPDAPCFIDVDEFDRLAAQPTQACAAVELYTGDLLAGLGDEWLEAPRAKLRRRQLSLLQGLIDQSRGDGDYPRGIELARQLLAIDSWREDAIRSLMALHHDSGDRAGAIQVYREFAQHLKAELDVAPTAETTAEFERISSTEASPSAVPKRAATAQQNQLPTQLTSFVGRETELAEAARLFEQTRLLTMSGTGGVGKTRLAIRFAAEIADRFTDGVWFVDFASLTDPTFVASTILSTVGMHEEVERTTAQTLAINLREKTALIVLDNCEHVVAEVAKLAETLLHQCPHLHLLVTSREVLEIPGEVVHRIPTFGEDEGIALFGSRVAAVVPSFAITAKNEMVVRQICKRLDGIPLAIELAAARVKMMTVDELRERLDDRFLVLTGGSRTALPRQRTLRGLIGWSYNLLDESEKALLRRLAIFAGDFSLDGVAVCAFDPLDKSDVLDILSHLIDKSLVQSEASGGAQRYRLLESTKEFCLEHLDEAGEWATSRRRHAEYFRELAITAETFAGTPRFDAFRAQTARDYGDYRAVLQWALADRNDVALGAGLAAALHRYWMERGQWREGRNWLELVVEREAAEVPLETLALALLGLSGQYYVQGEFAPMEAMALRAQEAYERMGDAQGQARARNQLAIAATFASRFERAYELYQLNLTAAGEMREPRLEAVTLQNMAELLTMWKADYEGSERMYARAVEIHRRRGDSRSLSTALGDWSQTAAYQGALDRADALARESLIVCREVGDESRIVEQLIRIGLYLAWAGGSAAAVAPLQEAVERLRGSMHPLYVARSADACAYVALALGRTSSAATLFGFGDEWKKTSGLTRPAPEQERCDAAIASVREALGDGEFELAWEAGRRLAPDDALALAVPVLSKAS